MEATATLARVVAAVGGPSPLGFDLGDEAATSDLTAVRQQLRDRLAETHDDILAMLDTQAPVAAAGGIVLEQLAAALAEHDALAEAVSQLLAKAEQPDRSGSSWLLMLRAEALESAEHHADALAVYDEILRRAADGSGVGSRALYRSSVCLAALERHDEGLARLRRAAAVEHADAEDLTLFAEQFLSLGDREAATAAAEAALARADDMPPGVWALGLAVTWARLGQPDRALDALEPLLEADGEPSEAEVSAHVLAAQLLLDGVDVPDPAHVVGLLRSLEQRTPSFADPNARMWLGIALGQLGRYAEALQFLDDDLDEDLAERGARGRRGGALYWRGLALLETDRPAAAEQVLRAAAELLREDTEQPQIAAYAELAVGIALVGQGRGQEARGLLDRMAGAAVAWNDPVLRGRVALWHALVRDDDDPELVAGLRRADELLPPDAPDRALLALRQARLSQTDEPERALALLDSIATPHPAWRAQIAVIRAVARAALGDDEEALAALDAALAGAETMPPAQAALIATMRGELLLRCGRAHEALAALNGVSEPDLTEAGLVDWFLQVQARAAVALDEREVLEAVIDRVVERHPPMAPFADLVRAETFMLRGDLDMAFERFRALEEPQDTSLPMAWVIAAQARHIADRPDADDALEQAIALDAAIGTYPFTQMTRAMAAASRGDVGPVDAYGASVGTRNERILYRSLRVTALQAAERLPEAIAELDELEAEAAQGTSRLAATLRAQALAQKALLVLRQGDDTAAERAVAASEALVTALPEGGMAALVTHLARGVLHMHRGEHEEADRALARAAVPETAPPGMSFVVDYLRGINWLFAGPDAAEDALRWLLSAVRRKPDDLDALSGLGEAHLMLEDPGAAVEVFTRALSLAGEPDQQAAVLRDKAGAERHLGRFEAAVDTARQATSCGPQDARNWLSLGASQLESGRHKAAAIAFRRAWRTRPLPSDEVSAQIVLGLTKALLDRDDGTDEALRILSDPRTTRLAQDEPLIDLNRAVALLRRNRHREAIQALRRAGRAEAAEELATARAQRLSWLGFWFGSETPRSRRALGAFIATTIVVALLPVMVNPSTVGWLGWVADGNVRPFAPLIVVLLLFLLPVATRIKLGDIELEQPTATAPALTEFQAASWDAVERKITAMGRIAMPARPTGATSVGGERMDLATPAANLPVPGTAGQP